MITDSNEVSRRGVLQDLTVLGGAGIGGSFLLSA
jgi:hypothetical protein